MKKKGFTLIELLVVVAIIAVLSVIIISTVSAARDKAKYSRLQLEFKSFRASMELYLLDHNYYPPDVSRNIPSGLEAYLGGGTWPDGPYPGSVYDWDNITGSDPYIQLSLRFCDISGEDCNFPDQD